MIANVPQAVAANLRGKIFAKYSHSVQRYPIGGIKIELHRFSVSKEKLVATAISAQDGMFYFRDVPAGTYTITLPDAQTFVFKVKSKPQQDLAPIVLEK